MGGGGVALQLFWSVGYVIHFCNLHEKANSERYGSWGGSRSHTS